jgi:hypothetical protein
MPRQINFLAERQKGVSKQQKMDMRLLRITSVVLAIATVGGVIIFGSFFYLTYQFNQIKERERASRAAISSNQETEAGLVVYVKKLTTLATIYKDRQDKNDSIDYFTNLFGNDVVVTGIDFDPKDKLLRFQVHANDAFILRRVLDQANSAEVKAKFPILATSDLTRKEDATYQITISIPISKTAG